MLQPVLVLATTNAGKLREMTAVLTSALPQLQLKGLVHFPDLPEVEENGSTFAENALLKARAYVLATGLPVLAEDAGLEVEALGGRPGVHSARYGANDAERITRLLNELQDVPHGRRSARFTSVMVLARPDGKEHLAMGALEGAITREWRGRGGFGYDPIFALPDGRTLAELSTEEKNAISHRGRALRRIVDMLPTLQEGQGCES